MTSDNRPQPIFTLRTDALAGRQQALHKLESVLQKLQQTADRTLLFYIAGDGGMGKTRLLQWIKEQPLPVTTFCTNILDFYNSILRTDVDLVEQIFDDIEPRLSQLPQPLKDGFNTYQETRDRYHRQDAGATGVQFREEVIDAFYKAWLPLAEAGYRMVILLDTAELLRFEDDPVRQAFEEFGAREPSASAKRWLENVVGDAAGQVDSTLPGVLFVVAGRKTEAKEVYSTFCGLAQLHTTTSDERVVELDGLSQDEIVEYLAVLATKLEQSGYPMQAAQLREDIDPALRQALFHLTQGSPIALAILLQIYIGQPSSELEALIDEQIKAPTQPVAHAEHRLQRALAKVLAEQQMFGHDTSTIISLMALARKGLTPARMRSLLPAQNAADIDAIFAYLRDLIFIKVRPDGSLVLHDKVADWAEEGLYGVAEETRVRGVYTKLVGLYDQEIKAVDRQIDQLAPKADPVESDEDEYAETPVSDQPADPVSRDSQIFRSVRRLRRNLLVDQMTYALRADPVRGYQQYFELAEEAFNVGRMDYESQIRAEFLGWWDYRELAHPERYRYRDDAISKGLTEELICSDFAIRVVQREYNRELPGISPAERMEHTVKLVRQILAEAAANRFTISEFTRILLDVYADTANGHLAKSDADIAEVRSSFQTHIEQLRPLLAEARALMVEDEESSLPLKLFLTLNALAFAHYEFAYFESNHGNHGNAIDHYTQSLLPYRALRFEINQARSLNDKAYSLAMMGDSDSAETAIEDAIRLRKRLGFSYLTALSYNTLGIVRTMGERPITGVRYCEYALRTFRGLNHPFGQMIASRALSEAHRRSAEYLHRDPAKQLLALQRALTASQTATAFARTFLIDADLLYAEILDESGCAYRDLARFCLQNPELGKAYQDAYDQGRKLLDEAITLAQRLPSARPYLVDSMINLAFHVFYRLERDGLTKADKEAILADTDQSAKEALQAVPSQYSLPTDPKHEAKSLTVYWAHLAKVHSLLSRVARVRLDLLERKSENRAARAAVEDELLRHAIYTLYFRSLLKGNVRTVRRSHLAAYESFRSFSVFTLNRLYDQAATAATELGIPKNVILEFLKNDFGLS